MPVAAERPIIPWCSRMRRSRKGRNTSTPSISTTSSTVSDMSPAATRHAPQPSDTAAPTAMPVSVMPRDRVLVASTHMVLLNSASARLSSSLVRAALWPNALSVASPWIASRKSAAKAPYSRARMRLLRWSSRCQAIGANSVASAASSSTVAMVGSRKATKAKISTGVTAATKNCGRYWPK